MYITQTTHLEGNRLTNTPVTTVQSMDVTHAANTVVLSLSCSLDPCVIPVLCVYVLWIMDNNVYLIHCIHGFPTTIRWVFKASIVLRQMYILMNHRTNLHILLSSSLLRACTTSVYVCACVCVCV